MTIDEPMAAKGYQYKHGDRPLDGYTIQRGAGRGGFGEVYYALSDSGREVALKVVHTYEQIELRGISQCMNLKSPYLVTIFDVKYGSDARPWVVMEFVSGPSLRELMDASPSGLGGAKAAFFIREIGKGLSYLHDCGIVHRDLKPANIFYENGYTKIGDYGLSKTMSTTQHSGQTVAVGTLHYMAPEIGEGRYDRSIDIYAMGAMLFEMLTGQVPFFGSSPAEVLMKHLTADVNLDSVEEPFKSVVRKAMAKNPAERYQSVQEMVEALFGSEAIRDSVTQFSPESLTMVAGRVAGGIGSSSRPIPPFSPPAGGGYSNPDDRWSRIANKVGDRIAYAGERIKTVGDQFGDRLAGGVPVGERWWDRSDTMTKPARIILCTLTGFLSAFIAASSHNGDALVFFFVLMSIFGVCIATKLAWQFIAPGVRGESKWVQRLTIGGPAAFGAAMLSFPFWVGGSHLRLEAAMTACFVGFLLLHWEERLSPSRRERFSIGHLFATGILGFILAGIFDAEAFYVICSMVGGSLAVSLRSPWNRTRSDGFPGSPDRNWPPRQPTPQPQGQPQSPASPQPAGAGPQPPPMSPAMNPAAAQMRRRTGAAPVILMIIASFFMLHVFVQGNPITHGKVFVWFLPTILIWVAVSMIIRGAKRSGRYQNPGSNYSEEGPMSVGGFFSSLGRGVAGLVGSLVLLVSLLLTLAVVTDLPGLFASGVLNPQMPADLARNFGTPEWPSLMLKVGVGFSIVTGAIGLSLLMFARRAGGGIHMLRAPLGMLVLYSAMISLGRGLPDWGTVAFSHNPNDAINWYLQRVNVPHVEWAAVVAVVGYAILLWPACRTRVRQFENNTAPAQTGASK